MGRLRGLPLPEHTEMDQNMQVVYHLLRGAKELEQSSLKTSTTGSSKHTNWMTLRVPGAPPRWIAVGVNHRILEVCAHRVEILWSGWFYWRRQTSNLWLWAGDPVTVIFAWTFWRGTESCQGTIATQTTSLHWAYSPDRGWGISTKTKTPEKQNTRLIPQKTVWKNRWMISLWIPQECKATVAGKNSILRSRFFPWLIYTSV